MKSAGVRESLIRAFNFAMLTREKRTGTLNNQETSMAKTNYSFEKRKRDLAKKKKKEDKRRRKLEKQNETPGEDTPTVNFGES